MHTLLPFNRPLTSPIGHGCGNGWKGHFACPDGWVGAAVGYLMAYKNEALNRFAIEQLCLASEDTVLEIGFGHGKAIELMAVQISRGLVAGIDHSMTMVTQAAKRNEAAIKAGRVELQQGNVSNIPYEYARFSKVVAINNYQFWPNPELDLTEIQRVMQPGGKLVLGLRLHSDHLLAMIPGFKDEEVQEIAGLVRWVGFQNVRVERPKQDAIACVIAER